MAKLLMVAYHFPPIVSGGVRRSVKFAQHLPGLGWEPVVLTVDARSSRYPTDPTSLKEISQGCKVVRTHSIEAGLARWAAKLHLGRLVSFFFVPDVSLTWVLPAVWAGLKIVRDEDIDAIYTSSMPISVHWIGLILHKLTGKPWLADWRDIWVQSETTLAFASTPLHFKLFQWLERTFVRGAAVTITHSEGHADVLKKYYPEVSPQRIVAIPMGFDPEDFAQLEALPFSKFTVLFAGTFYGAPAFRRPPEQFWPRLRYLIGENVLDRHARQTRHLFEDASPLFLLQAVRTLLDARPELADDFQVVFLGKLFPGNEALIEELRLGSSVKVIGWIPYEQSLCYMKSAQVLFLVVLPSQDGWSGFLPGKTIEYLATGRPILAMVPEGDVREIVRATRAGIVLDPRDVVGAKDALYNLYQEHKQGRLCDRLDYNMIKQYEWRRLTERLADVLYKAAFPELTDETFPKDTSRIELLYLIGSLQLGGAENQVVKAAKALDKQKFKVTICTLSNGGPLEKELENQDVQVVFLRMRLRYFYLALWRLIRLLKCERVKILHTHGYHCGFWGRIAGLIAGVPIMIHTDHGRGLWKKRRHVLFERFADRYTALEIAVSEDIRQLKMEREKIAPEHIITVPNAVDPADFEVTAVETTRIGRELRIENKTPVVGTVARLTEEKALHQLIQAAHILVEEIPNVRFLIVGDGILREQLEAQAHRLGLSEVVSFLGSRVDIPPLLAIMNIFVLSSTREGIPVAMLEAMAAGKPIVATTVGGVPEVVRDGDEGFLVPPGDPKLLADRIQDLLKDKTLRQRMGERAKRRIYESFSMERLAQRYDSIYRQLLHSRGIS